MESESRLYKALNGNVGLLAIFFGLISFIVILTIYVIRTYQAYYRNGPPSYVTGYTQNFSTKFLRLIVGFLFSAGFVVFGYYDINKMLTGDPLVSMKVENNTYSPSILFCSDDIKPNILGAYFYDSFYDMDNAQPSANLSNSFSNNNDNITVGKGSIKKNCILFNDTLFTKPKGKIGGTYNFALSNNTNLVFIGDFNDIDIFHSFLQGNAYSDIGMLSITSPNTLFTYEETRNKELDGGRTHRCYRINDIGGLPKVNSTTYNTYNITVIAPFGVLSAIEEPPLDLNRCFGNIGGYLTICCGIYRFLFGSGKMNPFGFVTKYYFQYTDLVIRVNNDLEKGNVEQKIKVYETYFLDMEGLAVPG
ncbi:hypothetical protein RclHR1_28440001 [Rhizophagus clarus]|uniref:Uncharacterized protein n=1 Tax=Rhizophagus clarus TaxID=94130 RepID=A0A2Z6R3B7_9GLOM|nr:hypothetical protein RclHR1_28440001 [Rhizophagus clarus]